MDFDDEDELALGREIETPSRPPRMVREADVDDVGEEPVESDGDIDEDVDDEIHTVFQESARSRGGSPVVLVPRRRSPVVLVKRRERPIVVIELQDDSEDGDDTEEDGTSGSE
jgi:hypothetical protein